MAETIEVTPEEIDALADKLESTGTLTDKERELLGVVFEAAARAFGQAADGADVAGYSTGAAYRRAAPAGSAYVSGSFVTAFRALGSSLFETPSGRVAIIVSGG